MAFVSDELFNEICMQNDIIDYASSFMTIKKNGKNYMACCPFHNEKTPSFSINRDQQLFHCFGCGASGNFVQLVMRLEGLDYRDAMKQLADRVNITIPENGVRESSAIVKKKETIEEMNKVAARFFYDCLADPDIGREARGYFAKRKLSKETIIKFGLGYAPNSTDALLKVLRAKGYSDEMAVEAGLAVTRNDKAVDKYRNRVIFPIINARGKVIGFGGRVIGSHELPNGVKLAKYLNSPQTVVFDKGANLFALNLAKNSNEKQIILCEGYMDVISVHQAGITNCVATLGTAITETQAKLLTRYANEILICYDMDEAGTIAALRAIDVIRKAGGRSAVMRIAGAKDPDEYISKYGVSGFKTAIEKAVPGTAFKLNIIKQKYDINDTDGKIRFVDEVAQCLSDIDDEVEVEAYINKVAQETGISTRTILGKVAEHKKKGYRKPPSRTKVDYERRESDIINDQSDGENRIKKPEIEAEKKLLSLMARGKRLCLKAADLISPEEFSNAIYQKIAGKLYDAVKSGRQIDVGTVLNEFSGDTEVENVAASVFFNNEEYSDNDETLFDLIYTVKLNRIQTKTATATDPMEIMELINQERILKESRAGWSKNI